TRVRAPHRRLRGEPIAASADDLACPKLVLTAARPPDRQPAGVPSGTLPVACFRGVSGSLEASDDTQHADGAGNVTEVTKVSRGVRSLAAQGIRSAAGAGAAGEGRDIPQVLGKRAARDVGRPLPKAALALPAIVVPCPQNPTQ